MLKKDEVKESVYNPSPYKRYKKLIDVTACNVADKVIEMLQKLETELMNIVELKSYHI